MAPTRMARTATPAWSPPLKRLIAPLRRCPPNVTAHRTTHRTSPAAKLSLRRLGQMRRARQKQKNEFQNQKTRNEIPSFCLFPAFVAFKLIPPLMPDTETVAIPVDTRGVV